MLFCMLLLALPGQSQEPVEIHLSNKAVGHSNKPLTPFAAKCQKLGRIEFIQCMDRLGRAKDFAKLKEIYESDISNACYAASVYARELPEDKVLAFCCQFDLRSTEWFEAFWALSFHRKQAVIGYIKQIAQSRDLYVRAHCYRVCQNAGWDDLVEQAKEDSRCTLPMFGAGTRSGQTVGTVAQDYINHFTKK